MPTFTKGRTFTDPKAWIAYLDQRDAALAEKEKRQAAGDAAPRIRATESAHTPSGARVIAAGGAPRVIDAARSPRVIDFRTTRRINQAQRRTVAGGAR